VPLQRFCEKDCFKDFLLHTSCC